VEDAVFVGSCAGIFYAFNKATGEVRWSYDIRKDGKQISFHGNPLIVDDMILIGTDHSCVPDGLGHVYAFDIKTGKVRWKYKTTSVPTDIVRIGQNVYFGSFQDNWYALKLRTGPVNDESRVIELNCGAISLKLPLIIMLAGVGMW